MSAAPGPVRARWLANLGLVLFSLVAGLLLFELAARLALASPGEPVASRYTEFDPLLGWRHRKGAVAAFAQGEYRINSLGLRDRERRHQAAPGTYRLMVLGDSFAEGFSVSLEDSAAQVLERSLDRPGCPVEVIAAGTVGYSTDQQYLFYHEEGVRYSPGALVLLFYYNDIVYNARASVGRAPKPLLSFKGGVPRLTEHPLKEPEPREGAQAGPAGSAALGWLSERLLAGAPRGHDWLARLGLWPRRQPARAGAELLVYARRPPREVQDAWAQTVNVLRALRDEAAGRGTRLLLVYVPSKMEISERDWELTRLRYGLGEHDWDRRQVARWLGEAGAALELPVLDTTEALRRQERGLAQSTYHAAGGHWNRLGHAVAALEVETFLRRSGWLPACSALP